MVIDMKRRKPAAAVRQVNHLSPCTSVELEHEHTRAGPLLDLIQEHEHVILIPCVQRASLTARATPTLSLTRKD